MIDPLSTVPRSPARWICWFSGLPAKAIPNINPRDHLPFEKFYSLLTQNHLFSTFKLSNPMPGTHHHACCDKPP
ncbi:hypothetical protein XENTR_v10008460 [Xenopus tropicalis]|nr:hypothetical protein XENTR_v10008460 [Xenopus tropicalis]